MGLIRGLTCQIYGPNAPVSDLRIREVLARSVCTVAAALVAHGCTYTLERCFIALQVCAL